ncbi:MAG: ATP-dependent DNA helicase RecG [Lachnospiraceae bacterium]|nr:ATP-dependent DNA helicase RecG [Lachnospiraceae bacterium]
MELGDPVVKLKKIGPKTAEYMEKLGITTVGGLLRHYPRAYRVYTAPLDISDTSYDDVCPAPYKVFLSEAPVLIRKGRTPVVIQNIDRNPAGKVQAIWYNAPFIRRSLSPGTTVIFYGRIVRKGNNRTIEHPEIFSEESYEPIENTLQPIYPLTAGIKQKSVQSAMRQALKQVSLASDYLPENIRKGNRLSELNFAIHQIHFPENEECLKEARARLVFDEFFLFSLELMQIKRDRGQQENRFVINDFSKADELLSGLPYKPTNAQLKVWEEIKADISGDKAMNRLVQGDVGSGKTLIASLAMASAAGSGYQSCLLAPTEVLAEQHYAKLSPMFSRLGFKSVLLTGAMTEKQKRSVREEIISGKADIVIGTHAVFQDKVLYDRLGLIVTDEQHRFGVRQRHALSEKAGEKQPHVLVMSATPIPRTLAIILYGDLSISVVDEKPENRLPVKNAVVGTSYRPTAYRFIQKQIEEGHQVYIICPLVEKSEEIEAEDVESYTKALKKAFPDSVKISGLNGRMKSEEKNRVMRNFSEGKIDILVSTTVVEVGVDVPNATVMMIENAERFGLAQLHQLRGRVGRGDAQSYCIFVYGQNTEAIRKRLEIMQSTNDGFKIASEDLKMRGPGDMFGIRQSGELAFSLGDIYTDSDLLKSAADAAKRLFEEDPGLELPEHQRLKEEAAQRGLFEGEAVVL